MLNSCSSKSRLKGRLQVEELLATSWERIDPTQLLKRPGRNCMGTSKGQEQAVDEKPGNISADRQRTRDDAQLHF